MKKIYLLILSVSLLALSSNSLKAQTSCPGPNPPAGRALNIGGICVVFADNLWPGATAIVLDINLVVIGQATVDATGFASIIYPCSSVPFRVTACTATGCCNAVIPPAAALPIKLSGFTAQLAKNNSVLLNWVSEVELSSFKYVVQKSEDGRTFSDIGEVVAAGNSNKAIKYNFTDYNFSVGATYFRLKQIDIDGKFEYSRIVYVNNRQSVNVVTAVAPNPFTSDVQLIGISSAEVNYNNIKVFNTYGQMVSYRIAGANAISIDASAPRGVYLLKIKDQTFKLFKN
jgi:hypothetical protein